MFSSITSPPHHGHSEVDGHFGSGKRTLRADGNGGPISERSQVVAAFEKLSNTTVHDLDVEKMDEKVDPLKKQIRKWFEWHLNPEGKVLCREKSGVG